MEMTKVELLFPKDMVQFVVNNDSEMKLKQNALLLYPYIDGNVISYGKAAELLSINKFDLINLYGKMGFAYHNISIEEVEDDAQVVKALREEANDSSF